MSTLAPDPLLDAASLAYIFFTDTALATPPEAQKPMVVLQISLLSCMMHLAHGEQRVNWHSSMTGESGVPVVLSGTYPIIKDLQAR